jgi:putative FmdB family regulatory protein
MPIYEYRCQECGALHEALQKISDAPLTTCPACGAEALTKKVSAAAFRLKGGGWYETDFKDKNKKNLAVDSPAAGGDGGKSAGDSGSSASGDGAASKPAGDSAGGAKTEAKAASTTKTGGSDA